MKAEPTISADRTFSEVSLYGSEKWCAAALGMSYDAFRKRRPAQLEPQGFPRRDALIGGTIKADVLEWIARRRKLAQAHAASHHEAEPKKTGVNRNAL